MTLTKILTFANIRNEQHEVSLHPCASLLIKILPKNQQDIERAGHQCESEHRLGALWKTQGSSFTAGISYAKPEITARGNNSSGDSETPCLSE